MCWGMLLMRSHASWILKSGMSEGWKTGDSRQTREIRVFTICIFQSHRHLIPTDQSSQDLSNVFTSFICPFNSCPHSFTPSHVRRYKLIRNFDFLTQGDKDGNVIKRAFGQKQHSFTVWLFPRVRNHSLRSPPLPNNARVVWKIECTEARSPHNYPRGMSRVIITWNTKDWWDGHRPAKLFLLCIINT